MTLSRRRFITISASAGVGLGLSAFDAQAVSWQGTALGAQAKLIIKGIPADEASFLIDAARAEIERLENIFSLYRNHSVLCRLNAEAAYRHPPHELLELLTIVQSVHAATSGRFDPTIQSLWQAYADHRGHPPETVRSDALSRVSWENVEIDTPIVKYRLPGMQMTLNGIAQGYVTDRVAALLRSAGLVNAIVSVGETLALGEKSMGEPWKIGIADKSDAPAQEIVKVTNQAVATSAMLGTTFDNGIIGHILDPKTGMPKSVGWKRISVLNRSAAIADALSTAFTLMEAEEISDSLQTYPGTKVIAQDQDDLTSRWSV